jgi:hypothetical protein
MRTALLLCLLVGWMTPRSTAQLPAVQAAVDAVNLDSLTQFVRQISGESPVIIGGVQDTIRSRAQFHPGNEKAFRFLREKMQSYGLQIDSVVGGTTGTRKSLIATLPGASPISYSIGAHYDCVGVGNPAFAGADDNGSGCAAVIEAARILSAMPAMPLTLRFCFWDEEELGLLGSRDYTQTALNPTTHRGYLNLDMIGYDGNGDSLIELYTDPRGLSQTFATVAENVRGLYNIGLQIERVDPGPPNTDYAPFWDLNYTAIGLAEDLAGDRNTKFHQFGDSLQLFNLPYFRKLTQLAIATITHSVIADPLGLEAGPAPDRVFSVWSFQDVGGVNLRVRIPQRGELLLEIFDAAGRPVFSNSATREAGTHTLSLANENLPMGIYICSATFSAPGRAPMQQRLRFAGISR